MRYWGVGSGEWGVASGEWGKKRFIIAQNSLKTGTRIFSLLKLWAMLNLSHKKLDVYQISIQLVKEVYTLTRIFPKEEQYVLISQLRRAAISVCSNLAEGAARKSRREKRRLYEISRSSAVEIDTQFEIALILEYLKNDQIRRLEKYLESVFRMLSKMIDNLAEIKPAPH